MGCEEKFEEVDIERFGSEEICKKYMKFRMNIEVDNDADLKWCPRPTCIKYVRKEGGYFSSTGTCQCGQQVCMNCGAAAHPGVRCSNVGDKELEAWASTSQVKYCPAC